MSTKLELHEYATLFPAMSQEDRDALKEDISKNGVIEPVVVWCNQIVDGRHRYEIANELDCYVPVKGLADSLTEEEVLEYVLSKNFTRRHMTSSQRAAVAADAGTLLAEMENRRGMEEAKQAGKTVTEDEFGVLIDGVAVITEGRTVEIVAARAGTNKQYLYDAATIKEGSRELLDRVKAGELTIPQAKKILNAPAKTDKPSTEDGQVIKDGKNKIVPRDLAEVFSQCGQFDHLVKEIREAAQSLKVLGEKDAAAFLWLSEVRGHLKQAAEAVRAAKPHAICKRCGGDKKTRSICFGERIDCPACKGNGWVPKSIDKLTNGEKS